MPPSKYKKLVPKTESTVRAYNKRMEWMKDNYSKSKKQIIKSQEIYLELLQKKATVNKGGWCTSAIQYFRQEAGLERYPRSLAKNAGITNIGKPKTTARKKKKSKQLEESSSSADESSSDSDSGSSSEGSEDDADKTKLKAALEAIEEIGGGYQKKKCISAAYRYQCPVPTAGGNSMESTWFSRSAWRAASKVALFGGEYNGFDQELGSKCITYIAEQVEKQLPDHLYTENYVVDRFYNVGNLLGMASEKQRGSAPPVSAEWFLQATEDEKAHIKDIQQGKRDVDHLICKALENMKVHMDGLEEVQEANDCSILLDYFRKKLAA